MLCVVIGIVPPLDDSTRTRLFDNVTKLENPDDCETRICWARDTLRESWVVPDEDADDIPTMLVSAFLSDPNGNTEEHDDGAIYDHGGNDLRITPEGFASSVQDTINNQPHNNNDYDEEYRCEVWASAPAPLPLITYGGNNSEMEQQCLESDFRQKGLCLLSNVLASNENGDDDADSNIRSLVDEAIHEAEGAIATNHPGINVGEDDFLFREIASRSKQRFDLLIGKETKLYQLVRDQALAGQSEIPSLLRNLFLGNENHDAKEKKDGDYDVEWEMDLSVVYSKPGANHQGWHADGGHTLGDSDAGWDEGCNKNSLAAPYAICLFVPLIDLNHTVGFTQFWPGSHKHRELVGFGPFAEVAKATWDGTVRAGEAIVYDYRLLHRGMPNYSMGAAAVSSADEKDVHSHPYRAVLQLLCRKTWYKERNNYGTKSIYQAESSSSNFTSKNY